MNDKKKPIKRNPALVSFSKDHHFALLLIWKIREGCKKNIDPERIGRYVQHFFDTDLKLHFRLEEELMFQKLPADNKMRMQAEAEHKYIYLLIEEMQKKVDTESLMHFGDTLEKHIRFEERELFNLLQETLTEPELEEIRRAHQMEHEPDDSWADAFWK